MLPVQGFATSHQVAQVQDQAQSDLNQKVSAETGKISTRLRCAYQTCRYKVYTLGTPECLCRKVFCQTHRHDHNCPVDRRSAHQAALRRQLIDDARKALTSQYPQDGQAR